MSRGNGSEWFSANAGRDGREELAFDEADGSFAIDLGDEPAAGVDNHLPIRKGGEVLLIRQTPAD